MPPPERKVYVAQCMDGTREDVTQMIHTWASDYHVNNILWLSGSPGAGKSAVAATMALQLQESGRLGSVFFFRSGHAVLNDPTTLWRTVAFDLAQFDPAWRRTICKVLEEAKVDPARPDVQSHFRYLIQKPLQENPEELTVRCPVVIIEALDECSSHGLMLAQRKALLNTVRNWSQLPHNFKLMITSRDELDIAMTLRGISEDHQLHTGELVSPQSSRDIYHFLKKHLDDIAQGYPDIESPSWTQPPSIQKLTKRAAGLFIWADIVTRFMEYGDPSKQLELILSGDFGEEMAHIDDLYSRILSVSFQRPTAQTLDTFRTVVGTILHLKEPHTRNNLKLLLNLSKDDTSMSYILIKLRTVILENRSDGLLRICHQSFAEFLSDPARCPEYFVIDRTRHNRNLALACLHIMSDNKSGLRSISCLDSAKHFTPDTKVDGILFCRLSYACRYWIEHVCAVADATDNFDDHTYAFLDQHLLLWVEAMVSLRSARNAIELLRKLLERTEVCTQCRSTASLLRLTCHSGYRLDVVICAGSYMTPTDLCSTSQTR
jgi:hypothetical protein